MSLNIKDPEAHELAKALARETGETLTRAVVEALRERLAQKQRQRQADARVKSMLEIGQRFAEQMEGPPINLEEFLYDENGLFK